MRLKPSIEKFNTERKNKNLGGVNILLALDALRAGLNSAYLKSVVGALEGPILDKVRIFDGVGSHVKLHILFFEVEMCLFKEDSLDGLEEGSIGHVSRER